MLTDHMGDSSSLRNEMTYSHQGDLLVEARDEIKLSHSEARLLVGSQSIKAYSRLSYTMWHALAEFIDNSTQSRDNYDKIIDDVLKEEGKPLIVEIDYNRVTREITIKDNSIGMTRNDLIEALKIANPTVDSKKRSKYGMGMKTAACWIGDHWQVTTVEFCSGEEWTADVDVQKAAQNEAVPLILRKVNNSEHYTIIRISKLHRYIQKRTEENIRAYLGSMYRNDIDSGYLKLYYDGVEIKSPELQDFDTDSMGNPMRRDVDLIIGEKRITGWFGLLKSGGRKFGGFSLFQNGRQIQGFPNAWKPKTVFGGDDGQGGNNIASQRLTGLLNMEGFSVSHTKDTILYDYDEEDQLEDELDKLTKDFRVFVRRPKAEEGQLWTREKVRDIAETLAKEFTSSEVTDALMQAVLPPLESIIASNNRQVASLKPDEELVKFPMPLGLTLSISLQEKSEHDPYVTIESGAEPGLIHIIINRLHVYYSSLESPDAISECMRQYIYDALSEYKVTHQSAPMAPANVRRVKDQLLKAAPVQVDAARDAALTGGAQAVIPGLHI